MREFSCGSSASNSVAERAIQSVQQQVRVLKLALEGKWKMKIHHICGGSDHGVLSLLAESVPGGSRWQNGVRAIEREEDQGNHGWVSAKWRVWRLKPAGEPLGKLHSL